MVGIRIYQPVARELGYEKPGGWRVEIPVEGVARVGDLLAASTHRDIDVAKLTRDGFGPACMVAVNRVLSRQGLQTEVQDGDEVSVFGLVSGG